MSKFMPLEAGITILKPIIHLLSKKADKDELPIGIPDGQGPYQQLVTDGEGAARWEDRLAYETPEGGLKRIGSELLPESVLHLEKATEVVVPETELEFVYAMYGGYSAKIFDRYKGENIHCIIPGETYRLTLDDKMYELVAKDNGSSVDENVSGIYLGDNPPIGDEPDNYGFSIGTMLGRFAIRINQSIFPEDPKVMKLVRVLPEQIIPEKYIPGTIQRVGASVVLNSTTAGSTKQFRITVDDSGTLTATEVT